MKHKASKIMSNPSKQLATIPFRWDSMTEDRTNYYYAKDHAEVLMGDKVDHWFARYQIKVYEGEVNPVRDEDIVSLKMDEVSSYANRNGVFEVDYVKREENVLERILILSTAEEEVVWHAVKNNKYMVKVLFRFYLAHSLAGVLGKEEELDNVHETVPGRIFLALIDIFLKLVVKIDVPAGGTKLDGLEEVEMQPRKVLLFYARMLADSELEIDSVIGKKYFRLVKHLYDLGLEKEPMNGIIDVNDVRSASVRDWMSEVREFRDTSTKGPSLMMVKKAIENSLEYLADDILEPGSTEKSFNEMHALREHASVVVYLKGIVRELDGRQEYREDSHDYDYAGYVCDIFKEHEENIKRIQDYDTKGLIHWSVREEVEKVWNDEVQLGRLTPGEKCEDSYYGYKETGNWEE